MKWEPFLRLYNESHQEGVRKQISSGCADVIMRSTWGQFAKTDSGLSEPDIAMIVEAMTNYILVPLIQFSEAHIQLSRAYYIIGSCFETHKYAKQFSQDLLAESAQFNDKRLAKLGHRRVENRAIAAILFRHKYCFLAGEYFEIWGIANWLRIIMTTQTECVCSKKLLYLLDALESTRE